MAGKFTAFAATMLAATAVPSYATEQAQQPVKLDNYLDWESAGGSLVSPAGDLVAYRRTKVDPKADRYDADLWLMDADGKGARLLADAWSPAWLPDGRLSYLVDGEKGPKLMIRTIARTATAKDGPEIPVEIEGPSVSGATWSPNGASLAYIASVSRSGEPWPITLPRAPEGAKWSAPPAVISTLQYRVGVDQYRTTDRHILVASSSGGKARQITSGPWQVGAYYSGTSFGTTLEWTRDGEALVFEGLTQDDGSISAAQRSDINRVDVATGKISKLSQLPGFWRLPRVSPNGRLIAYTGNRVTGAAFEPQELRVMDIDGGNDRQLLPDMPDRIFQYVWSPDGNSLLISMNHEGSTKLWRVGLDGKQSTLATGKFRFYISSAAGKKAYGSLLTQQRDSEIASVDLSTGHLNRLTTHNSKSGSLALASSEEIWAQSADGTRVQGWLYRPAGFDSKRRYPLILDIHGGPDAMGGYDFDFRYHDFAARGYMVATSNPGGSTGYGSAFANRIQGGFPGEKDQQDLEAFLDAVVARGGVDPERIFVMGCSGGGALTAWLAARTRRFAAAAVMCPVTDWISLAGTTDVTTWAFTRFKQPYWEDPQSWLAHSPLMQVGKIDIPVLIANGARDQRTPTTQAAELYTALRVRGVPSRLLVFPNEGHGPWRSIPSNLMRLQLYIDEWFRTLGNPASAAGSDDSGE